AEKGSAAGIVQSYASRILEAYSDELSAKMRPTAGFVRGEGAEMAPIMGLRRVDVLGRSWYKPHLGYRPDMWAGLMVALVTMIATLVSAQNIAREKELGTLEQLNVTPLTRGQFVTAKLLPFWVLGIVDLGLGLVAGRVAFGIPMRGSLLLLFAS